MRLADLREVVKAEPFRPFVLHFADGGRVRVPHPERIACDPRGRSAVVYKPDGTMQIIDLMLVSRIVVGNGTMRTSRSKKK